MQPHRRQPTRLPHPWDSPGKNTGVGCHFFLQCIDPIDCSLPGSSIHGIFQARVLEWGAIALDSVKRIGPLALGPHTTFTVHNCYFLLFKVGQRSAAIWAKGMPLVLFTVLSKGMATCPVEQGPGVCSWHMQG